MLEMMICDLHWNALHTGVLATLMNAWMKHRPDWTLWPFRHLMIEDSEVMLLTLKFGAEIGLPSENQRGLERLYREIAEAKARLQPIAKARTAGSRMDAAQMSALAATWTRLAREAARALMSLRALTQSRLPSEHNADNHTLVTFLEEAASGKTDRVGAQGDIRIPQLRQRRSTPRVEASVACRLEVNGVTFPAQIVDVSRRGLGLSCKADVQSGARATVALLDGRRLAASVMRRGGDRLGLQLSTPLSATDPLFRAG